MSDDLKGKGHLISDEVVRRRYKVGLSTATAETWVCPCGREPWGWQDACPKCGAAKPGAPAPRRSRPRSQLYGGSA